MSDFKELAYVVDNGLETSWPSGYTITQTPVFTKHVWVAFNRWKPLEKAHQIFFSGVWHPLREFHKLLLMSGRLCLFIQRWDMKSLACQSNTRPFGADFHSNSELQVQINEEKTLKSCVCKCLHPKSVRNACCVICVRVVWRPTECSVSSALPCFMCNYIPLLIETRSSSERKHVECYCFCMCLSHFTKLVSCNI